MAIERLRAGDRVLSRDEHDVGGEVGAKAVEETFVRHGEIWELRLGGRTVLVTPEHPVFVRDRGWTPAGEVVAGDELATLSGEWRAVASNRSTGETATVYNLRVADWHTYFVGDDDWPFALWVHNAGASYGTKFARMRLRQQVAYMRDKGIPGADVLLGRMQSAGRNVRQGAYFQARRAVHYYKAGSLKAIEHSVGGGAVDLVLSRGNILVENKAWWKWDDLSQSLRRKRLNTLGQQVDRYLTSTTGKLRLEFKGSVFDEVEQYLQSIAGDHSGRLSWRAVP